MDGGSGLNILYAETLQGMGIPMSRLSESNMQFHGVIPGKKAKSLGQIALDVVFGDSKNFRKEKLTFEVVDFHSAYHAILGRSSYARFMARPCYVYLKLKMPEPKGVITVTGNSREPRNAFRRDPRLLVSRWLWWSWKSTRRMLIRVIFSVLRSLLLSLHFSRLARRN
jgi:hypothetical protein